MRLLPPSLTLICLVAMVLLHWLLPITTLFPAPFNLLGLAPLVLGVIVNVAADRAFKIAGTNVKTFNEPDKLITDGWFRYSRNPMYLGFVLALVGVWMLLGTLTPAAGVLAFLIVADRWYVPFEERMLAAKFGAEYAAYKRKTRRWL